MMNYGYRKNVKKCGTAQIMAKKNNFWRNEHRRPFDSITYTHLK